jgi:hypothetical protein
VQDLLALYSGTTKICALLSVNLGQVTATSIANQRVRIRRLPTAVTPGSAGAAVTPRVWVPGDATPVSTARINDTVQASSSGSAEDVWDDQWNLLNGFLWVPAVPNRPPLIGLSEAFIVSLDSAPATITASGSMTYEEFP